MAIKIEEPSVLVVEGEDDKRFFEAFIKHLELQNIQSMPIGGKQKFRENLKALKASPEFSSKVKSLGIVRDADSDAQAAFRSVCDALKAEKLPVPKNPLEPVPGKPRVAVLILPGKNECGALEDLCLKTVAQDSAMHCVEQYFECLKEKQCCLPHNMSKAKVQVFLASRRNAGLRPGEAAQAGFWPWENAAFKEVRDFLKNLVS